MHFEIAPQSAQKEHEKHCNTSKTGHRNPCQLTIINFYVNNCSDMTAEYLFACRHVSHKENRSKTLKTTKNHTIKEADKPISIRMVVIQWTHAKRVVPFAQD